MRKNGENPKLLKTGQIECKIMLDTKRYQIVPLVSMKGSAKKSRVPEQIKFRPDDREKEIIQAAYEKRGLKKAQDVISMALVHWAESGQLELKAS